MVNTKLVKGRRSLRFAMLDEAIADAERCAAAERDGKLRRLGNWTLGQILGHLAFWANAPFDGYPALQRPPKLLLLLMPLFKGRFINGSLPVGLRIPKVEGGTFGTEPISTEEGLARLRRSFARLGKQTPSRPNPAMGTLTHEEWIKLNLRHAELHLSFVLPE